MRLHSGPAEGLLPHRKQSRITKLWLPIRRVRSWPGGGIRQLGARSLSWAAPNCTRDRGGPKPPACGNSQVKSRKAQPGSRQPPTNPLPRKLFPRCASLLTRERSTHKVPPLPFLCPAPRLQGSPPLSAGRWVVGGRERSAGRKRELSG